MDHYLLQLWRLQFARLVSTRAQFNFVRGYVIIELSLYLWIISGSALFTRTKLKLIAPIFLG